MGRVPWKENKVISIETRKGVFVLAQMLRDPYLMFYNIFRDTNDWDDVDLEQIEPLLCHATTRQFISGSNVTKQNISPILYKNLRRRWIDTNPESESRTIWEGTPKERNVIVIGKDGGQLIEYDINTEGDEDHTVIKRSIPFDDHETIDNHELTSLFTYPAANERLYLCFLFGRNVDPLRDIIFNRPLRDEYDHYIASVWPKK